MPVRTALLPGMLVLGALLLAGPAQPAAARPEGEPIPAEPAPAPPAPADLAAHPGAAQPQPPPIEARPFTLPPGMEALPQGIWRLRFAQGSETPPRAAEPALTELGRRLAAGPEGRVVLLAQASGPAADVSTARRLSLARGLAVKEALVSGGLPATRIDVRPLGRTEEAADAVDVQPPGIRRAAP
jgi:outer membrane protein OmpA-like peptidoglycan-associated protein